MWRGQVTGSKVVRSSVDSFVNGQPTSSIKVKGNAVDSSIPGSYSWLHPQPRQETADKGLIPQPLGFIVLAGLIAMLAGMLLYDAVLVLCSGARVAVAGLGQRARGRSGSRGGVGYGVLPADGEGDEAIAMAEL